MILIVALLVESLAAVFADKRFVAGMDACVGVQCGRAIEGLAAGVAFVRFVGCVDDLVAAQGGRLAETFAADFAYEWTGASVNGHVPRQIVVGIEHLTAFGAGKCFLLAASTARRTDAIQTANGRRRMVFRW